MFKKLVQFMFIDVWHLELTKEPFFKRIVYSFIRIIALFLNGVKNHLLLLHAASLTFVSLMSMVPILALMFSLSKGLGAQKNLRESIDSWLLEMPIEVQEFIETLFSYVDKTDFGAIGIFGLIFLFYTAVNLLSIIEHTFNTIWGVKSARSLFRKFTDYTSVVFVVPILLMLSTSVLTSLQSPRILSFLEGHFGVFTDLYNQSFVFAFHVIIWIAFTFLYMFMPNKKVHFLPCLVGGMISGELWMSIQWVYLFCQFGITNYNAIYGALAVFPIFLIWLFLVWIVILLGAEISYAIQNFGKPVLRKMDDKYSFATTEHLGVLICIEIMRSFLVSRNSWSLRKFLNDFSLPEPYVQQVVNKLVVNGVLAKKHKADEYLPAKDLSDLTVGDITFILRGESELSVEGNEEFTALCSKLSASYERMFEDLNEVTFKEIVADNSKETSFDMQVDSY